MEASEYVIEIASTTGRRETLTDSSLPLQYDGGFWGIAPYRHVSIYIHGHVYRCLEKPKNTMKIKPLIFLTIAVLFSTLLNRAATARPLEQSEQEVNNQLQQAIKSAKDEGYQLSFPPNVAKLARKAEAPKTVMLYPNREYSFVAVCDRNCDQIRLAIKDKDGKSIMVTPTADPVAVVTFKPPSEDRYQITVKMEKCSLQSCYIGLGIFAKR